VASVSSAGTWKGYTYLAETFLPSLAATRLDAAMIETITVANPRRWLTIAARA
jgi:predicted metal-dependent phosphotriesterase family hydrolase